LSILATIFQTENRNRESRFGFFNVTDFELRIMKNPDRFLDPGFKALPHKCRSDISPVPFR